SEVQLAKVELKETGSQLAKDSAQVAIAAGLLVVGALPLTAFLVIGLGKLLKDNFWLSSLIVGLVFISVGTVLTMRALKKFKEGDVSLPRTRLIFEDEG